jgi:RNA methyltransferase, TrmH family
MPGKKTLKFINSLKLKKYRKLHGLFLVEGEKMVGELIKSDFSIHSVYGTSQWIREYGTSASHQGGQQPVNFSVYEVTEGELHGMSNLTTPNKVLAVAGIPSYTPTFPSLKNSLSLVLDNVQDPGNAGTLIRSAEWFGIDTVILSENSAEITSPKVVQSTMGSVFRVKFYYLDLPSFLQSPELKGVPIIGTFVEGPDIYKTDLPGEGLIVLGNESRGISTAVERLVTRRISIPALYQGNTQIESLNIGVAGSIIMSEFRRRTHH